MKNDDLFTAVPNLPKLLETADHVDVKTIEGNVTLRQFIAGMLTYSPVWLKDGDKFTVEVDGVGRLTNHFAAA